MNIFDAFAHAGLRSEISQTRLESGRAEETTIELEARVRLLEKTTGALWSLVKAKTGWTDEELIEHAKALDAVQDPGSCQACGRRLIVKHAANCSWCGHRIGESLPGNQSGIEG